MWYVYFLELSNHDVYVGSTNDLKRRVFSTRAATSFRRAFRPVRLLS
jgi:putative endonuclease